MNKRLLTLATRFKNVHDKIGRSKISSGTTVLTWRFGYLDESEPVISIELGGYDLGDWKRHQDIGEFTSIEKALDELEKWVVKAEDYATDELGSSER